jgi:hypothetical protein
MIGSHRILSGKIKVLIRLRGCRKLRMNRIFYWGSKRIVYKFIYLLSLRLFFGLIRWLISLSVYFMFETIVYWRMAYIYRYYSWHREKLSVGKSYFCWLSIRNDWYTFWVYIVFNWLKNKQMVYYKF